MFSWRAVANGLVVLDKGELRLTVEAPLARAGGFRFTVLRRQYGRGSPFAAVETGMEANLLDAIAAAELAAGKVAAIE